MAPRKTMSQKMLDLHDTHKVLQIFYRCSTQGVPAGCTPDTIPMKGVPTWHRKQADKLISVMRSSQVVRAQLSAQSLDRWEKLIALHQNASLFWWVDNLNRLWAKPAVNEPFVTEQFPAIKYGQVIVHGSTVYENNRQDHWFQYDKTTGMIRCFLTGIELNPNDCMFQ